jgi:hypothetical protein
MSYRRMRKQDLWEIYRRWQAGQSVSRIAANERRDRKTVRQYLEGFERLGLVTGQTAVERQRFYGDRREPPAGSYPEALTGC